MIFQYFINLDERGDFYADVRDEHDHTVWETHGEVFEDGFMKHKHDYPGLARYLSDLGIMKPGDVLRKEQP